MKLLGTTVNPQGRIEPVSEELKQLERDGRCVYITGEFCHLQNKKKKNCVISSIIQLNGGLTVEMQD